MTIREFLKTRAAQINRKCIPISGLAFISALFARGNAILGAVTLVIVFGIVVMFVALMRQTPCPRCSMPLGTVALRWKSNRQPEPRCPHCGVGIDQQMSGPAGS